MKCRVCCSTHSVDMAVARYLAHLIYHNYCSRSLSMSYALSQLLQLLPSTQEFWNNLTVQDVQSLYKSLAVTASRVLGILQFLKSSNPAEERILGYLSNMIGNMNEVQLQNFLRFVTGSSVVLGKDIHIQFNGLSGLARQPIAHTCDCVLELPVAYNNFQDFFSELVAVLSDTENCWQMNSL